MNEPDQPRAKGAILERFTAPRYCDVPFPAYRFTPGVHPHPTAHPDGHSYEGSAFVHPVIEHTAPDEWRQCKDYLYGCDLYNHAYWWEAHEAWEALWKAVEKGSVQHRFLQGLIQTSACHLKRYVGQGDGVARLKRSSKAYLHSAIAEMRERTYMGMDSAAFVDRVAAYHAAMDAHGAVGGGHDPAVYPYIILK